MRLFEVFPFLSFLALVFMILIKVVVLKNKGVKTSAKSSKQANQKYLLYPAFIVFILSITFELLKPAFQISLRILPHSITNFLFQSIFLQFIGVILLCFSLIIMGFTLVNFKNSLRFGISKTNLGKLITTGIFSCSRNPFFLALDIYFIGISFIYINLFFIVISLLTAVSIHLFIQKEEQFLMKNYGKEYKDYKQKVRRYF
jgi:protein-S-isoprenylcysteine O-methyltransferase Ste14